MKKIEIDLNRFKVSKIKGKPNSAWAEAIENVIKFMGEDNKRFGYWSGRLKKFTPAQINDTLKEAKSWPTNPVALFNKLIKQRLSTPSS